LKWSKYFIGHFLSGKENIYQFFKVKIEKLKAKLLEKDPHCKEIQSEYESLLRTAEKVNTLLIKKTKEIQLLKKL
jgi:hypothetical protein